MPAKVDSRAARSAWVLATLYFAVALLLVEGVIWLGAVLRASAPLPVHRGRVPERDARIEPNQIDGFITDNMKRTGVPGVVIAIVSENGAAYTVAYGTASSGEALLTTTPMPLASLSNSMTATVTMRLVEAGRLSLDDRLRRILPDIQWSDPRIAEITIAQLLNQSSGLACHDRAVRAANAAGSLSEALEQLRFVKLRDEPGASWRYCNANYHLLAAVIQRLTGEEFAAHMSRTLFAPLGMFNTSIVAQLRESSTASGQVLSYGFAVPHRGAAELGLGAGGVVSTADDLSRWLMLQFESSRDAESLGLNAASLEALHTPSAPDSNYAFGWRQETLGGQPYLFHSGRDVAYSAHQAVFPKAGYAYVILWNSLHPLGAEQRSFINGLNAIILGEPPSLGRPVGRIVDSAMAAFTVLWLAIGLSGALGARHWVQREWIRPYARAIAPLAAYGLIGIAIFTLSLWTPGTYAQNVSLPVLFEVWPAVALLLLATGIASLTIVISRGVHVRRAMRHIESSPTRSA